MSVEQKHFDATEKAKVLFPTLSTALQQFALAQADEFISAGQSAREATSIVANIMIGVAWTVAAIGVLSEGGDPDKDKFRAAVEAQLASISFVEKEDAA